MLRMSVLVALLLTTPAASAAPGDLDTSYGNGGAGVASLSGDFSTSQSTRLAATAGGRTVSLAGISRDGRIVFALRGQLADGSPDPAFGSSGLVTMPVGSADAYPLDVAADGAGHLVVAGFAYDGAGSALAIVRLDAATGVPDAAFGVGGVRLVRIPGALSVSAGAVTVDAAGRIAAVAVADGLIGEALAVVRLTAATGALDATFDGDGIRVGAFGAAQLSVTAVAAAADGSVVVAGASTDLTTVVRVARFGANGAPDAGFGTAGVVETQLSGQNAMAADMQLGPAGTILIGGTRFAPSASAVVARFTAAGALDATFGGGDGWDSVVPLAGVTTRGVGLAVQSDGALVLAAEAAPATGSRVLLARFSAAGVWETQALYDPGLVDTARPTDVVTVPGGIAVHGQATVAGAQRLLWMRGPTVSSMPVAGTIELASPPSPIEPIETRMGAAGPRTYVASWGFAAPRFTIAALDAAGDLDPAFDADGQVAVPIVGVGRVAVASADAGGVAVVATLDVATIATVIRLGPSGAPVAAFDGDGQVTFTLGPSPARVHEVLSEPNGGVMMAGAIDVDAGRRLVLARRTATGAPDPAFGGGDGIVEQAVGTLPTPIGLHRLADGRYVVVAVASQGAEGRIVLARFEADGDLDPTFGGGTGIVSSTLGAPSPSGFGASALLANGGILVAAEAASGTGLVARFTVAGAPDAAFSSDGFATVGAMTTRLDAIVVAPDGAIVVGGMTFPASRPAGLVARLTSTGELDTSFGDAGMRVAGLPGYTDVALEPGGRILLASTQLGRPTVQRLLGDLPTGAATQPATGIRETRVTLHGTIDPGAVGNVLSRFVLSPAVVVADLPAPAAGVVTQTVSGLRPGRTYTFRLDALGDSGVVSGASQTFRTPRVRPRVTLRAPAAASVFTLRGSARDPAPSSGIRRVEVSLYVRSGSRCSVYRGNGRWRTTSCAAARRTFVRARLGPGSSRRNWSLRVDGMALGRHTLVVRSIDGAGLVSGATRRTLQR